MLEIVRLADTVFHRNHAHHRRIHFRRRVERFGRYFNQHLHIEEILQHHAQAAVIVGFRLRHHALHHLFLQHEVHIGHFVRHFRQMKQQRRGNIVGQIADDFFAPRNAAEIKLQHVAFMNHQLVGKRLLFQKADNVAVDFAHVQLPQMARERLGNRRQSGPDFNHDIIGLRADGIHDVGNNARVLKKILPEAFAGFVCCAHQSLAVFEDTGRHYTEKQGFCPNLMCAAARRRQIKHLPCHSLTFKIARF